MIKRVKGSELTDEFLESFAKIYNAFKSFDLCPGEITSIFMKLLDVTDSTIRRYVRKCRQSGLINDSYEENRKKMLDRQKGKQTGDEMVKAFITDNVLRNKK